VLAHWQASGSLLLVGPGDSATFPSYEEDSAGVPLVLAPGGGRGTGWHRGAPPPLCSACRTLWWLRLGLGAPTRLRCCTTPSSSLIEDPSREKERLSFSREVFLREEW